MNMHRWLVGVAVVVAVAACGSATDATSFQAPPGYTKMVSVGPFGQVWGGQKHGGIVLMALPGKIEYDTILTSSNVKDAEVLKQQPVRICGSQDAYYYSLLGETEQYKGQASPGGQQVKQQIDVVATHLNDKTYLAMYIRPKNTPEDPAAETAIHGVCPKV